MHNPYTQANAREREHLAALADRLNDVELSRPMEAGWTAAGVLAHLAFWDLRALTLLRKWQGEGIGPSPMDTDVVNEATRELCNAIAPRAAARLALSAATAIDEAIAQLDAPMLAAVETEGPTVRLDRSAHRRLHLGEIEQALQAKEEQQ